MKITLLYPPPWRIPAPGEAPNPKDGPFDPSSPYPEDPDFYQIPYGLLSIAAQVKDKGYDVDVFNLSRFHWVDIETVLQNHKSDIFGISCFSTNRLGAFLLADYIKNLYPKSFLVLGGPFITALPVDTMQHYPSIDVCVVGEGEETFLELIDHVQGKIALLDIKGIVFRHDNSIYLTDKRDRIADLDVLVPVTKYYNNSFILTSRGCPGRCTYCGSQTTWGSKITYHSPENVLDQFSNMVEKYKLKQLYIKDDTFTSNKKRAIAICQGLIDRKINITWNCDTRVDAINEELLHAMRSSGCQMLSFGIESGNDQILKNIKKKINKDKIRKALALSKKYGFLVRCFMMAGNRGDTVETLNEGYELIQEIRPHKYFYSLLSAYPGTEDFEIFKNHKVLTNEMFFANNFMNTFVFLGSSKEAKKIRDWWFEIQKNNNKLYEYSVGECIKFAEKFPELHLSYMDLGRAYFLDKKYQQAFNSFNKALALNYPIPSLAQNYIGLIYFYTGHYNECLESLKIAHASDRRKFIGENFNKILGFLKNPGQATPDSLDLFARHDIVYEPVWQQPERPGPIMNKIIF